MMRKEKYGSATCWQSRAHEKRLVIPPWIIQTLLVTTKATLLAWDHFHINMPA